jgi:hypothetical protein
MESGKLIKPTKNNEVDGKIVDQRVSSIRNSVFRRAILSKSSNIQSKKSILKNKF